MVRPMRRRGILGGTFNPIHIGHLLAAEEAATALGLDEVLFMPAGDPWMRAGERLASKEDRWNMAVLATQTNPRFAPSRLEIDRDGPTYTVDTLAELQAQQPAAYWFILGIDALLGLPRWREPVRLLDLCRIAAVARPGYDARGALDALSRELPGAEKRVDIVEGLEIGVSATDIRQRVQDGRSIRYRVPDAVERYIIDRGLYKVSA